MKNLFKLMGTALMASLLFASCEKDPIDEPNENQKPNPEPTPEVVEPKFPEHIAATVMPGSEYSLTIQPNMAWEVTVPEATAAYFQIKDGDNKVYTKRGEAGEYTIVISVAAVEEFDTDRVCEVSMTMKGQTEKIATLTLSKKEREMKIYPVSVEDGTFGYATEGEFTYAYQTTEVTDEGVTMIWPLEMALYSTRVKIESNFNWVVDGTPSWIVPLAGGQAGVTELWIKGDENNYPLESQSCILSFVDAVATDKVVATVKVTIPAATDIFTVEGFSEVTEFNYQGHVFNSMIGEYVEGGVNGSVTAVDGSNVVAVEFAQSVGLVQPQFAGDWLTVAYDNWDTTSQAVIQTRKVVITAAQNSGAAREATVLVLPKGVAADNIDLIAVNGEITAEYLPYVVTTVKQAADPGSIDIVGQDAMAASGTTITALDPSHWMFGNFSGATVAYELLYTSKWAHEDWYVSVTRPYTAVKCYSFDSTGNFVEISGSAAWITTTVFGTSSQNVRIEMDVTKSSAASAKNEITGDYEGAVAFEDESGVFAFIYCRYNEAAAGAAADVAFYYPEYAAQQNSTLVELTSGELYTKYASYGEKVFHLTYTTATPNLSMLTGLPDIWDYVDQADKSWLKYEYSVESQVITMNADEGNGKTGALVFGNGALVIVCTLNIAQ